MAGALPEAELYEIAESVGLVEGRILAYFDCFRGTSALDKLSKDLRPQGVNFSAIKRA
ncbi:hypothetical protein [Haliangium sp.]|uniref:hypothetical protein n=1 Tax=Haliangium sp. TaxID=2663208 RepID=UPI003D0BE8DC